MIQLRKLLSEPCRNQLRSLMWVATTEPSITNLRKPVANLVLRHIPTPPMIPNVPSGCAVWKRVMLLALCFRSKGAMPLNANSLPLRSRGLGNMTMYGSTALQVVCVGWNGPLDLRLHLYPQALPALLDTLILLVVLLKKLSKAACRSRVSAALLLSSARRLLKRRKFKGKRFAR